MTSTAVTYRWTGPLQLWTRRYLGAEVAGLTGAIAAATTAAAYTGGNRSAIAVSATLAESICFYAVFTAGKLRQHPGRTWRLRVPATIAAVAVEFGPAEAADILLIRPAAMYAGPLLLGHLYLGVIAGKVTADIVFYLSAIASYELLLRRRCDAPTARTREAGPRKP